MGVSAVGRSATNCPVIASEYVGIESDISVVPGVLQGYTGEHSEITRSLRNFVLAVGAERGSSQKEYARRRAQSSRPICRFTASP